MNFFHVKASFHMRANQNKVSPYKNKRMYLNIVYANFSIKGRCRYHSRYFRIPMQIKVPVGPSRQLIGNLRPTPPKNRKTVTKFFKWKRKPIGKLWTEMCQKEYKSSKRRPKVTSPEIVSQHIVRLSLPQVSK